MTAAPDESGEIIIGNDHSAQMERLKAETGEGDLVYPGFGITPPIVREQIIHGRPGFSFDRKGLQPGEPAGKVAGVY